MSRLRLSLAAVTLAALLSQLPRPAAPLLSPVLYLPQMYQSHRYPDPRHGIGMGPVTCEAVYAVGAAWFYNWGIDGGQVLCDSRYVDMIYGRFTIIPRPVGDVVLGFNEFDAPDQSNLTPDEAALLWREIEQTYPDKFLVCPVAVSGSFALFLFLDAYVERFGTQARCDAMAVHYHYPWTGGRTLAEYVTAIHDEAVARGYNGDVWVTELGICFTPEADALRYMRESVTWLAAQPWVSRWAWYVGNSGWKDECWRATNLFDDAGSLTVYGEAWRSPR